MRTSKVLASGLQLLMAILCMLLGGLCILIPLFPLVRSALVSLFTHHPGLLPLLGYFSLGLGLLLFIAFYAVNRGQYYQIGMHNPISVDSNIVQTYASHYFRALFPDQNTPVEVVIRGRDQIELIVELPDFAEPEQEILLQKIENELGSLLEKYFKYKKTFIINCLVKEFRV